ncbi:MAG: hypothetical protein D6714_00380 [Bacteroidetes bacterium]|nr:MAG: hypothetical protein D6714_00380 [Bacteroidota bacterium]
MKRRIGYLVLVVLVVAGCEKLFIDSPDNSVRGNFEAFWLDVDRIYPYLVAKNIDWDEVHDQYSAQITDQTTEKELFGILSEMVQILEDGHVNVWSSYGNASFDFAAGHPVNSNYHALNYIDNRISNSVLTFGTVKGHSDIGYIQIRTFGGSMSEFNRIEEIVQAFETTTKGVILDIRSNGGGSDLNGLIVAGRFADQSRLYRLITFRNGPEWTDFAPWSEHYVNPMGAVQYTKPVVVLTNRSCFSACEGFTRMMKVFPNVTVVGDTTAGGSGNPIYRELPNGWEYRLSTWLVAEPGSFDVLEGKGLPPDIQVNITEADSLAGIDRILEKAIELLD